jgi:hypothetical protein
VGEALAVHCAALMPARQCPARVAAVDQLPCTATGKLDRLRLGRVEGCLLPRLGLAGGRDSEDSEGAGAGDEEGAGGAAGVEEGVRRVWGEVLGLAALLLCLWNTRKSPFETELVLW